MRGHRTLLDGALWLAWILTLVAIADLFMVSAGHLPGILSLSLNPAIGLEARMEALANYLAALTPGFLLSLLASLVSLFLGFYLLIDARGQRRAPSRLDVVWALSFFIVGPLGVTLYYLMTIRPALKSRERQL